MSIKQGHIKKIFAGGNTAYGFYSLYDYIAWPNPQDVYIIKGGPGTGKSTFIKEVGTAALKQGYPVEYILCSSDNNSYDGLYIPGKNIGIIDGTAPHTYDPKHPGVIHHILNFGDYWETSILKKHKTQILFLQQKIENLFLNAYNALKETKVIYDELRSSIYHNIDFDKINRITLSLISEIFNSSYNPRKAGRLISQEQHLERHLFAGAITSEGVVNHLETVLNTTSRLFFIKGEPGNGKSTLLYRILEQARLYNLQVEIYHCPLDPQDLSLLIIPEIKTALLSSSIFLHFEPHKYNIHIEKEVDLSIFINRPRTPFLNKEINQIKNRLLTCLTRSISHVSEARKNHYRLEEYYKEAMNYDPIKVKCNKLLKQINIIN